MRVAAAAALGARGTRGPTGGWVGDAAAATPFAQYERLLEGQGTA